ncbi:MAG: DUF58 domain-containing protein [Clostridiales bacterium]|nr:DUF58 domain-containing protein [Clostridiales bacterium]
MQKANTKPHKYANILKKRSVKRTKKAKPRINLPISFTMRAWMYPVIVIAALFLAQSLKLPISNMVFLFVLLLPLGTALQLIAAALAIHISVNTDSEAVQKRTPVSVSFIISNSCPLPFPFIEAEMLLPDERGAKCVPNHVGFTLIPLSGCEIRRAAKFAFRGVYSVGLTRLCIYDCFRMVKLNLNFNRYSDIFVIPRRYELPPKPLSSESEQSTQTVVRQSGQDNTELSDIRAYINGDSLKSIHWKLSSKSQDLIVKDFSRNTGNSVYIICDLEPHYRNDPDAQLRKPLPEYEDIIDNLNSDLVVEKCLAAALRELRALNTVNLLWFELSKDGAVPVSCTMTSTADLEACFRRFASAPLVETDKQSHKLASLIPAADGSSLIFVTSCIDSIAVEDYTMLAAANRSLGAKTVELMYCIDESLYLQDPEAEREQGSRLHKLSSGMELTLN